MATYTGTAGNDNYTGVNKGTTAGDTYNTYGGNDTIDSYSGGDLVYAGAGNDFIYAGDGNDTVYGGVDNDWIVGDLGNDVLYGDDGNDTIDGGLNDDAMYGGANDDFFTTDGVSGWDSITGGTGSDTIILSTLFSAALWGEIKLGYLNGIERIANTQSVKPVDLLLRGSFDLSTVRVDGIRMIVGQSSNDYIIGTSNTLSSSLNDNITGGAGSDTVFGGVGDDTLLGGTGNDILTGGVGNDNLKGEGGSDTFAFGSNEGSDSVLDFTNGTDIIDLRATSAASIGDLSIVANGAGWAQITVESTIVTLVNVVVADIDASDFIF